MKTIAAPTPLDMEPFSLLAEALADCQQGNGTSFVRRMVFSLLTEVAKENPGVVAMPDGKSILASAWAAGADIGFYWWKLRGEESWLPTAGTEQPLIEVIKNAWATRDNRPFRVIGGSTAGPAEARQFFQDGLKHAMPLRQVDVDKWDKTKRLTAAQKSQVIHQSFLTEYCLTVAERGDLPADHKIKDLLAAGGVLPTRALNNTSPQSNYAMAQIFAHADSSRINATVTYFDRFGERGVDVSSPWWKLWKDQGRYTCEKQVIKAMRKRRIDPAIIKSVEQDAFAHGLMALIGNIKTVAVGRAWELICERLDQQKGGWDMADENGLAWQQALGARPGMLTHALTTANADLAQKSDDGIGIWDHLTAAVLHGTAPLASLKRLASKFPAARSEDRTPFLWLVWPEDDSKCESFMKASVGQHPDLWLGSDKNQWDGIFWLLEQWARHEPENGGRGTTNLNILFGPSVDRSLFSDGLKVVMQLINHVVVNNPKFGQHLPNVIDFPITEAVSITEKRLKQLDDKIRSILVKNVVAPALKVDIEAAQMQLRTAAAPEAQGQGRRMRL